MGRKAPKARKNRTAAVDPQRRSDADREDLRSNLLYQLSRTLLYLSSVQCQMAYKAAVPFVHIPRELDAQWANNPRMLRDMPLFRDCFSESHRKAMMRFDKVMKAAWLKVPHGGPDVPERFQEPTWKQVMIEARVLRRVLADVLPKS